MRTFESFGDHGLGFVLAPQLGLVDAGETSGLQQSLKDDVIAAQLPDLGTLQVHLTVDIQLALTILGTKYNIEEHLSRLQIQLSGRATVFLYPFKSEHNTSLQKLFAEYQTGRIRVRHIVK